MSRNIWVTSDTHYNHEKIITFIDYNGNRTRDFENVEYLVLLGHDVPWNACSLAFLSARVHTD